ncbi:MAG TPA: hypothetical protein VJR03_04220, partial [Nitrospira sp.]|nr:hypothetical protein [Nitrospira sp.]
MFSKLGVKLREIVRRHKTQWLAAGWSVAGRSWRAATLSREDVCDSPTVVGCPASTKRPYSVGSTT